MRRLSLPTRFRGARSVSEDLPEYGIVGKWCRLWNKHRLQPYSTNTVESEACFPTNSRALASDSQTSVQMSEAKYLGGMSPLHCFLSVRSNFQQSLSTLSPLFMQELSCKHTNIADASAEEKPAAARQRLLLGKEAIVGSLLRLWLRFLRKYLQHNFFKRGGDRCPILWTCSDEWPPSWQSGLHSFVTHTNRHPY